MVGVTSDDSSPQANNVQGLELFGQVPTELLRHQHKLTGYTNATDMFTSWLTNIEKAFRGGKGFFSL